MKSTSPITKPSRSIPTQTSIYLYVRAGGRCEFDGCNKYLLEHPLTGIPGNFAHKAHIFAFSEKGPRGQGDLTPDELNNLDNLILVCPTCHKEIDDHHDEYTVEVLQEHKRVHEERVYDLTGTAPERQTTAVVLKARISGQLVDFTIPQMQAAVAPYYITPRDVVEIDLTALEDGSEAFFEAGTGTIAQLIRERYHRTHPTKVRHVSVFALAPIPLLVVLGAHLSDKVPTVLYQRHRDTEDWRWKDEGVNAEYTTQRIQEGTDPTRVALVMSLSGRIKRDDLPNHIDEQYFIYEMTLVGQEPNPMFLSRREDLLAFQRDYELLRRQLSTDHSPLAQLEVFPSVPAPVAVACGRDFLPKVDPTLIVYDYNKSKGGFVQAVKVN